MQHRINNIILFINLIKINRYKLCDLRAKRARKKYGFDALKLLFPLVKIQFTCLKSPKFSACGGPIWARVPTRSPVRFSNVLGCLLNLF